MAPEDDPADDISEEEFWRGWAESEEAKAVRSLSPEEAEAAYNAAPAVPLSEERIAEIVEAATETRPCEHDGCDQDGDACFLADDPEGKPSHWYCSAHAHENGFCSMCGGFFAGIESFDFGNGLCDECDDAVRSDAGEFDDDDVDGLDFEDI